MGVVYATATAPPIRLALHCVTLVDRVRHPSRELLNVSHIIRQLLDPYASYKKKLAQHSLYGPHGRGHKETEEEEAVGGSEEEKERVTE